jgi:uncharacterized protein YbcI
MGQVERSTEDEMRLNNMRDLLASNKRFVLETHEEKLIYQHIKPDFNKIIAQSRANNGSSDLPLSLLGAQLTEVYSRLSQNFAEETKLRLQIKELMDV